MAQQIEDLNIENAHIIFRNFAGEATKFNRGGKRNFCVILDNPEDAQTLADMGWNIKELSPLDEGEPPRHYLQVEVGFGMYPPAIWLISGNHKTLLNEHNVASLDGVDIRTADLTIRPYCWDVNGKTGVKAYLKNAYIVQNQDAFAEKYANLECGVPF